MSGLDAVLEHVAVLAFLYYPGIEADDPSYDLADGIEWCLVRLGDVSDAERNRMSALFERAITDPTATREELFTALVELDDVLAVDHHE
ncbi:hypothetical protein [Microbacterium sp. BK668]|uniref:hypothetical protein n=1 Tax=Microbacterium sp. BK668 TaxID=2512118 RepID=UPI00105E3C00|nr:hypothetical protein [Microbacterium sp. BK668]TDN92792.1 hypothetical protein EV279_2325 [Microbacterium sp. BK668]